jgi:GH25 family lysozyme M1 (1,4-beta-N-acetylmuramidase)
MCGQFCAAMYGYGSSGYRDALTQWNLIPAGRRHPGKTDAPAGSLLFWGGGSAGHGHVAIADGLGNVWSIDISGAGTVSSVPAGTISSRWGLPYLGWTVPYFQGQEWEAVAIYGVDVSMFQPINFLLTTPGDGKPVDFVIIKVTEGSGWTSSRWTGQRQWAKDHGLSTGFYHFARPGNMVDQADRFLSQISLQPGDHLWFDWEDAGVSSAQKDAWISYVQGRAPGHRVGLYCNTSFWLGRDMSGFAGDGLWIATGGIPAGAPPIQSNWLIHQYSTDGGYDHDLAQFASRADMITWAQGDDMPLSADDKTWISAAIRTQVTAVVKAESYAAVFTADKVRSPDDAPANPTWAPASYLREGYLRLLEILAAEKSAGTALANILSQSQTNGSNGTAANMKLDEIRNTLAALDLSQLPADIAAKIESLKITVGFTEGT